MIMYTIDYMKCYDTLLQKVEFDLSDLTIWIIARINLPCIVSYHLEPALEAITCIEVT